MNPTLELIDARTSTRVYAETSLTPEERHAVLHAAMRAPTAGNLMLYSIIEVGDQRLKDRLAVICDDQPFIAKAPWVLVFVADYQKWIDLFEHGDVWSLEGVEHRDAPGPGDLMLACSDALIAAQTAVIAAESLGIGSCYIGDIMERAEEVSDLLELPRHAFPVAMLCLGRPALDRPVQPRMTRNMVMRDRYHRLSAGERDATLRELAETFASGGLKAGARSYADVVYRRKFAAPFTHELNRSVAWWLERWQTPEPRDD